MLNPMSPNQDLIPSTAVVSICLRMVTFNQWAWNYQVSISEAICHIVPSVPFAKLLQSCPTLCDPIDSSPPGSTVPGILQARTLEWVAISFSNAWKWKVKVKSLSLVQLLATPWTAAHQAPPSMGVSRHEYWSGVPLPSQFPLGEWLLPGTVHYLLIIYFFYFLSTWKAFPFLYLCRAPFCLLHRMLPN